MRNNATAISYKGTLQAVRRKKKNTAGVNAGGVDTNSDYADTMVRTTKRHGRASTPRGSDADQTIKNTKIDFPKASRLWITCRHNRLWCRYSGLGRSYKRLGLKCICLERRYKRLGVQYNLSRRHSGPEEATERRRSTGDLEYGGERRDDRGRLGMSGRTLV